MRNIYNRRQTQIQRKCGCCKENIYIGNDNIDEAIYYDKVTYHSSCFINLCNKRSKRKNTSQKWTAILNNLDSIKQESCQHLDLAITKESVYNFIREAYDVTIIPTTVIQKISDIYNGTYKGMSQGIPPEHLLNMWERKMDMLNEIADRNIAKGIRMNTDSRIKYDLSVLINKYDSYLKWLEKQRIIEAEKETENSENIVSKSIGYNMQQPDKCSLDNNDISDLVDDIFG